VPSSPGKVEISRIFSCFSGEISVMNGKLELKLVEQRIRS